MIRCKECGTVNDDAAGFCGGCGQFLEWTGERIEADAASSVETAPESASMSTTSDVHATESAAEAERVAEAERLEAERVAEAARLAEAERVAEAARLTEAERLEAEAERVTEAERVAEAERLEVERLAEAERAAEAERRAEAERASEATRVAEAERLEAERVAGAERLEAERVAEAARVAEAELLAEAERLEAERVAAQEPPTPLAPRQRRGGPSRQTVVTISDDDSTLSPPPVAPSPAESRPVEPVPVKPAAPPALPQPTRLPSTPLVSMPMPPPPSTAPEAAASSPEASNETIFVPPSRVPLPPADQPPAQRPGARPPTSPAPAAVSARTTVTSLAGQPMARPSTPSGSPAQVTPAARPGDRKVAQFGDRVCFSCSEPNDPTRRFCRRCGTSLANAPIHSQKRPWYRRILGPPSQAQAVGQPIGSSSRPGASGKSTTIKPMPVIRAGLAVVVAIGIVGVIAVPSVQGIVLGRGGAFLNDIRRLVAPELVPVYATGATASSEIEEHPGTLLIDRFRNTDWQAPEATPSVKLTFDAPFDLAAVWVHNGTADNYTELRRPTRLAFVFSDGSTTEIALTDDHEPQRKEINVNGIRELEIRVLAATGPADAPLALSEIEFIGKR